MAYVLVKTIVSYPVQIKVSNVIIIAMAMAAYVDNSEENANKKPLSVGFIERTKKGGDSCLVSFYFKMALSFLNSFLMSIWFFLKTSTARIIGGGL